MSNIKLGPDSHTADQAAGLLVGAGVDSTAAQRLVAMLDQSAVRDLLDFADPDGIRNAVTFPVLRECAATIGMTTHLRFVEALRAELGGATR